MPGKAGSTLCLKSKCPLGIFDEPQLASRKSEGKGKKKREETTKEKEARDLEMDEHAF